MVDWPLQQACNPSWPLHCLMCREHFCHLAAVGAALSVIRLWNRVFIVLAFFYTPALISVRFRTDCNDQRGNNENDDEQPFAGILPSCGSPVQMMQRDCRKLANMSPTNISQIFHQPQTANICWATVHLLLGPDKYRNRRARSMQLISASGTAQIVVQGGRKDPWKCSINSRGPSFLSLVSDCSSNQVRSCVLTLLDWSGVAPIFCPKGQYRLLKQCNQAVQQWELIHFKPHRVNISIQRFHTALQSVEDTKVDLKLRLSRLSICVNIQPIQRLTS